ncbi:MAG: hypothetical protein CSA49_00375 [Gammaproteobacteria bacterium]|nr:MAG: hypothetical protein CSA49_00375 [Gammaproteobacteria bacterium]
MAKALPSNNVSALNNQQLLSFLKSGLYFCLAHWLRLFVYSVLTLFLVAFLYAFTVWAVGSYKILSDDPTVWQSSIDTLNQEDNQNGLLHNNTLFVGSSSIRLFENLEALFPGHNVLKKGFGGAKINDLSYYKENIIFQYKPKLIVMYIGINDILYRNYQEVNELSSDLFTLTDEITYRFPDSHLVLLALRDLNNKHSQDITIYNQHLKTYASSHANVHYIDANQTLLLANNKPNPDFLMWDGLHLNKKGYETWGIQLNKQLNQLEIVKPGE